MMANKEVAIQRFTFNPDVFQELDELHYVRDLWPLVYLLSDGKIKKAYVGETTDTFARMSSHLKNDLKKKLTAVHLITSEKFHKSATLDIESLLIKYISADGQYKLLNGNIGVANHNYYQKKEVYWNIFKSIWNKLIAEGISKHSIEHLDNSDLFKYSPYKTLSRDQRNGLMIIIDSLLNEKHNQIIVEGGAGTGKTILAIFLFKLINSDNDDFNFKEFDEDELIFIDKIKQLKKKYANPKMALVVPMSSFRKTLKKVFKNIHGLSTKMIIGPAEVARNEYDILLVDESHRLRRRVNLGAYFGVFDKACEKLGFDKHTTSELDWVVKQSKKLILFYDEGQSIKPSDTKKEDFDLLKSKESTHIEKLKSQFRVRGGNDFINYVDDLLSCKLTLDQKVFESKNYEFRLLDSIEELVKLIKQRNEEHGLSRLIAGYSWKWISNKDKNLFDITIKNTQLKWNNTSDDWINSPSSVNEVGCIHTTQGYDLNYSGIIFGNEISYDKEKNEIVIIKENYFDKNGKNSITDPEVLKNYILNIYKTILLRGIRGTYIYVCDDNLREYFAQYIKNDFSVKKPSIILPIHEVKPYENAVPIYDLKVAAGNFSEPQNVMDHQWVILPSRFIPTKDLFACTVVGESMNKVIPNGSICLFRKYSGGSRDGRIVLCEHTSIQDTDFGSSYTIKEFKSKKNNTGDTWRHHSIVLIPKSYNSKYSEIELAEDDLNDFRVIGIFECVLT